MPAFCYMSSFDSQSGTLYSVWQLCMAGNGGLAACIIFYDNSSIYYVIGSA